jgi:hypothetical protein
MKDLGDESLVAAMSATPARDLEAFVGIARGAWGEKPTEVEAQITESRESWHR